MIRSFLCTPLHLEEMLFKLSRNNADAFILDLEDGVRDNYKEDARQSLIRNWDLITSLGKKVFVRINKFHSKEGFLDLIALTNIDPEYIILPKVESKIELELIRKTLSKSVKLCPIIETPKGIKFADEIVSSMNSNEYLFFGEADLTTELRISLYSNFIKDLKRQLVLITAQNKINFVDSPCFRLDDSEFLVEEIQNSFDTGFAAKIAIHPSHIEHINTIFEKRYSLTDKEAFILENYKKIEEKLVRFDGDMIGPPMIRNILNKKISEDTYEQN
jgi:citrate lyase beta subunit